MGAGLSHHRPCRSSDFFPVSLYHLSHQARALPPTSFRFPAPGLPLTIPSRYLVDLGLSPVRTWARRVHDKNRDCAYGSPPCQHSPGGTSKGCGRSRRFNQKPIQNRPGEGPAKWPGEETWRRDGPLGTVPGRCPPWPLRFSKCGEPRQWDPGREARWPGEYHPPDGSQPEAGPFPHRAGIGRPGIPG